MNNDDVRKAAERAVAKLADLTSRQWNSQAGDKAAGHKSDAVAEQNSLIDEYDAAIADIVAFRRTFPNG